MYRFIVFCCALVFLTIPAVVAPAAVVSTGLELIPADHGDAETGANELDVSFERFGSVRTTISGDMLVDIDLDSLGNVSGFRISGGSFTGSPWTFDDLSASETGGTFGTPGGSLSAVNSGGFDASEHRLIINSGTIEKASNPAVDFAQTPLPLPGVGTGSLSLTPVAGREFNVRLELPVENESIPFSPDATIGGTIVAEGSVTAVPEASSLILLSLLGGGVGLFEARRRRRRR